MSVQVQESGTYELIEAFSGTTILGLNGKEWYAWEEGDEGDLLVLTDDTHSRRRMIDQGDFLLVNFENESEYRDIPHLFLGHPGTYEECLLPQGLPDQNDTQKRIIPTDITIGEDELERYLKSAGSNKEDRSSDSTADLPIDNYETLSVDEIAERLVDLAPKEIEELRRHEETHQNRKSLRQLFNRHLEGAH